MKGTPNDRRGRAKARDALTLALGDLGQAERYAKVILEGGLSGRHPDARKVIREALETGLILAYSRSFTPAKDKDGHKRPTLLPQSALRDLTRRERALHAEILKRRHQERAHTDWASYAPTWSEPDGVLGALPVSRNPFAQMPDSDVRAIVQLLDKIMGRICDELATHGD